MEAALETVPHRIEVFDRESRPAYYLGDGVPRIAAGYNTVNPVDSDTGRTRLSTAALVERFSRLCQEPPGIAVMPQDCPYPKATILHAMRAAIANSTKPLFQSTDSARVNAAAIALCRAAFRGDMRDKVYGITQLSPTSPLYREEGGV